MLMLIIPLIGLVISLVIYKMTGHYLRTIHFMDQKIFDINEVSSIMIILFIIMITIQLALMPFVYIGSAGKKNELQTRCKMLTYQYEYNIYDDDDTGYGRRELIKDIQEWNEHIANRKALQRDIWIGMYIPNIYDELDQIELHEGEPTENEQKS